MSKSKVRIKNAVSAALLCIGCPCAAVLGLGLGFRRSYYLVCALLMLMAALTLYLRLSGRPLGVGETAVLAVMTALCVTSRCAFVFFPQIKPMCALVVITGCAFGADVGFAVGAFSMFLSNFMFGQGLYTLFQMLAMGMVGFVTGIFTYRKKLGKNRALMSIFSFLVCFAVYGFIVDLASVLIMSDRPTLSSAAAIYFSSLAFNAVHAATTAALTALLYNPLLKKFSRLREKYGVFLHGDI